MSDFLPEGIDPAIGPEGETERKEALAALSCCFQELPLLDQQVFMMRAGRSRNVWKNRVLTGSFERKEKNMRKGVIQV